MSDERLATLEMRLANAERRIADLEARPALPSREMEPTDDLPPVVAMQLVRESTGLSPESARQMNRAVRLRYSMTQGPPDAKAAAALAYLSEGDAALARAFVDFS